MDFVDLLDRVPLPRLRRPRMPVLDVYQRRRLGIAVCILGAGAVLAAVLAASPGGPGPDARTLVPADARLYAEVHMDPSRDAVAAARRFADALPVITRQVSGRAAAGVPGLAEAGVGAGNQAQGWVGDEAAVALTDHGSLGLVQTTDEDAAARYARSLTGAPSASSYRGVSVYAGRRLDVALLGDFVAVGEAGAVHDAIDVSLGAPSLANDAPARAALAALPGPAFARLYLTPALTRPLWPMIGAGPAAVGIRFDANAMQVDATVLMRADSRALLSGLASFRPSLPDALGADTLSYLGVGPAGTGERTLLRSLGTALRGTARDVLSRLGVENGGALARTLAPALGAETALAVLPGAEAPQGGFRTPPSLGLISKGVDEHEALRALARLRHDVVGELRGDRLLIAGDEPALQRLAHPHGSLGASSGFQVVAGDRDGRPGVLAYFDLAGLVPLFEAAGLAENPAYASFAPEVRRLDALGLAVRSSRDRLNLALRLAITGK